MLGVMIGKNCQLYPRTMLDTTRGKIIIGNDVLITRGTIILSHSGYLQPIDGKTTVIGDNVKIFVNSIILPGVHIGNNSIIGAGSVVTKDIPENVVAAGNPARIIKKL